jgi:hypothetical protein
VSSSSTFFMFIILYILFDLFSITKSHADMKCGGEIQVGRS